MNHNEIMSEVTELFRDVLDQPDLVLSKATTAHDIPGWDSLRHVRIVIQAETTFGIRFTTAEINSLRNVGDMADLIAAKRGRS